MAIRTIRWTVAEDGMTVSPTTCMDGGVQGDHNKTRAEFVLPLSLTQGYDLYVEYVDVVGAYDTTEKLQVENGIVGVLLPQKWTQNGGEATLRLVAMKDGEIGYTLKGKVRYHSRAGAVAKIKTLLEGCIQAIMTRMDAIVLDFETKLARGELVGPKGDKGDTGDVSLVDEIELVMDGGDAGGNIDFEYVEPVDYVVEQGQAGAEDDPIENRWTYRKWASGLVELWSSCNINTAFTTKITDHHYAGASFPQIQYPFHVYGTPYNEGQCIHCQFSLMYSTIGHLGYCLDRYGTNFNRETPKYTPYMPWEDANSHDITARFYVTGRWKE